MELRRETGYREDRLGTEETDFSFADSATDGMGSEAGGGGRQTDRQAKPQREKRTDWLEPRWLCDHYQA